MKKHLPLLGIAAAVCLFLSAAARYPGGTTSSATTVGYDWTRNFISSLFAARALNGAVNPARYFAFCACWLFAVYYSGPMIVRRLAANTG